MKTQFVTDDHGKKLAVILPIKKYNKMVEEIEVQEDIQLYDKAKREDQEDQDFEDAEKVFDEIEKEKEIA